MINPFLRITSTQGKQYLLNINYIVCVERLDNNQFAIHLPNDIIVTSINVDKLLDNLYL